MRKEGWTVLRMSGSHGFVDLVAIKPPFVAALGAKVDPIQVNGLIKLIQAKTGKSAKRAIKKVVDSDIKRFEGLYSVSVEVV